MNILEYTIISYMIPGILSGEHSLISSGTDTETGLSMKYILWNLDVA